MDRMPGRVAPPWCPACHTPPARTARTGTLTLRQVRRRLRQETDREYEEAMNDG